MASHDPAPTAELQQALPDSPSAEDPGDRGSVTVHDKVVERLAARAALNTAGVRQHSSGLGRLTGRDLPRARVQVAGNRVRAGLDLAVAWHSSLPTVTAAVQRSVAVALTTWVGLSVDAVDVSVLAIVADVAGTPTERRVQ